MYITLLSGSYMYYGAYGVYTGIIIIVAVSALLLPWHHRCCVCSWRRLVRKRIGPDQVRVDICYITPSGRRLRTFPEIQNHLDLSGENFTLDHFTFSKKVDLGEVLDNKVRGR